MGNSLKSAQFLMDSRIADAAAGDTQALFELGVIFSTGTHGADVDMVEAHKWFNLAAMSGVEEAQAWRAEIACDMTPRQIADAQKAARAFLQAGARPN